MATMTPTVKALQDYYDTSLPPALTTATTPANRTRRRGRPPGSKNRRPVTPVDVKVPGELAGEEPPDDRPEDEPAPAPAPPQQPQPEPAPPPPPPEDEPA